MLNDVDRVIYKVSETVFRGPRPTVAMLEDLHRLGVNTILSLEWGWYEIFRNRVYSEDEIAMAGHFVVKHAPMSDFFAPTAQQVRRALYASSFPKAVTYVHCAHGVDRTGFVIAAYRVRKMGWSVDAAIQEWKALGFHKTFYFWWITAFRKMMKEF